MSEQFYRAFEDKHRGSRALIKARLSVYLPFVEPLLKIYPQAQAIDLGCGRGEWLELLGESGFQVRGVDMDEGMLEACHALNLKAELKDALTALRELPDTSQSIVSGFHLVEHIPFEVLLALVVEAKRVLVPGGLLIFETPNPENLIVGTSSFYLDPTHIKPIPPLLLSFLPEFVGGYSKIKMIGLQEPAQKSGYSVGLIDIFTHVSPDYALIAQADAPNSVADVTSAAFFVERGVTLPMVTSKFDDQLRLKLSHVEAMSRLAIQKADASMLTAEKAEQALVAIYNSKSWKITAPLRWLTHQISLAKEHGILTRVKALVKKLIKPFVVLLIKFLRLYPRIFRGLQAVLNFLNAQAILQKLSVRVLGVDVSALAAHQHTFLEASPCSARTEKALGLLKAAIKKKNS
jgi:O-antigen chain-terminating methyltransferase